MEGIGRIVEVPVRSVWHHEALDFTRWLASDGLGHLVDQLGLELEDAATEQPQGDLFADIVATDSEGRTIVIENQLERTDHGHLGQIITYLAIEDAGAAVWISPDPRPEHVRSVEWINEQTEIDLWLIKISVIRIEDSPPAPQFTVVAGPEISKQIKKVKREGAGFQTRADAASFWDRWLPVARERVLGINLPARAPNSVFFSRRLVPGLPVNFLGWVTSTDAYAEIRIQGETQSVNDAIFDAFRQRRVDIEQAFGEPLTWERLDGSKDAKIDTPRVDIGARGNPTTDGIERLADVAARLVAAVTPHVEEAVAEGLGTQVRQATLDRL